MRWGTFFIDLSNFVGFAACSGSKSFGIAISMIEALSKQHSRFALGYVLGRRIMGRLVVPFIKESQIRLAWRLERDGRKADGPFH